MPCPLWPVRCSLDLLGVSAAFASSVDLPVDSSDCSFRAPVMGHFGDDEFRHLFNMTLDFWESPNHVADAFWVADPKVSNAFWSAGVLDRPSHPIHPEASTMRWPRGFSLPSKHLLMPHDGGPPPEPTKTGSFITTRDCRLMSL